MSSANICFLPFPKIASLDSSENQFLYKCVKWHNNNNTGWPNKFDIYIFSFENWSKLTFPKCFVSSILSSKSWFLAQKFNYLILCRMNYNQIFFGAKIQMLWCLNVKLQNFVGSPCSIHLSFLWKIKAKKDFFTLTHNVWKSAKKVSFCFPARNQSKNLQFKYNFAYSFFKEF